jgi:uncharacterized membrane protein YphA (DoxX/SURF4 family)
VERPKSRRSPEHAVDLPFQPPPLGRESDLLHPPVVGTLEVLAAIGLVVPPLVHVATFLTPLAAVGLVVLMGGAVVTHVRRSEAQLSAVNGLLLILAAVVAVGRIGPYPF